MRCSWVSRGPAKDEGVQQMQKEYTPKSVVESVTRLNQQNSGGWRSPTAGSCNSAG